MVFNVVQCYTMLYDVILCCIMLYNVVLCQTGLEFLQRHQQYQQHYGKQASASTVENSDIGNIREKQDMAELCKAQA